VEEVNRDEWGIEFIGLFSGRKRKKYYRIEYGAIPCYINHIDSGIDTTCSNREGHMKKPELFLMKMALALLAVAQMVFGLTSPYLISATALSDSSVQLTWRNNETAGTGAVIQRIGPVDATFQIIDSVKSLSQVTYTDIKNLMPQTAYTYRLRAYNATEISDTSNSLSATTFALTPVFIAPSATVFWDFNSSEYPIVRIQDSSNCESGYRVYRAREFSDVFAEIAYIPSLLPKKRDAFQVVDTSISLNTWYAYKISAIQGDSARTATCTTFTFRSIMANNSVHFEKIGSIPVAMDSGGWSAKKGDSIILKENPSAEGKFTVLNVADPANPKFDGYIDSATLLTYPAETLIPVFLGYGVKNTYGNNSLVKMKDEIIISSGGEIRRFRVNGNGLDLIDSLNADSIGTVSGGYFSGVTSINDSVFAVTLQTSYNPIRPAYNLYSAIFNIGSAELRPLLVVSAGSYSSYIDGSNPFFVVLGVRNTQILASSYQPRMPIGEETIIGCLTGGYLWKVPRRMPLTNACNTGFALSKGYNLYTNSLSFNPAATQTAISPIELYAANPWDLRGYETATANNAVFIDSTHKQKKLNNMIADTTAKVIYLVFNDVLTVLKYEFGPANGIKYRAQRSSTMKNIIVLSQEKGRGVAIILPLYSQNAVVNIFDVKGRVIDRISSSKSNTVFWRPGTNSKGCYVAVVRIGSKHYCERFVLK
jgi:hypothetical protein